MAELTCPRCGHRDRYVDADLDDPFDYEGEEVCLEFVRETKKNREIQVDYKAVCPGCRKPFDYTVPYVLDEYQIEYLNRATWNRTEYRMDADEERDLLRSVRGWRGYTAIRCPCCDKVSAYTKRSPATYGRNPDPGVLVEMNEGYNSNYELIFLEYDPVCPECHQQFHVTEKYHPEDSRGAVKSASKKRFFSKKGAN